MPLMLASIGLSATARIALPVRVKRQESEHRRHDGDRDRQVLDLLRADADAVEAPVAPDRQVVAAQIVAEDEADDILERDGERDRADRGRDEAGGAERLEHQLVGERGRRCRRPGRRRTATGTIGRPKLTLATKPAKAPMVACEASAKLAKRSTAKMAVRPMAGTARMVPAMMPLRTSCRTSVEHRARQATFRNLNLPLCDLL